MSRDQKPELIAAKLTRVSWWRAALARLGVREDRQYQETLDQLAQRNIEDCLGEEDVKSWLAMLDGEARAPGGSRKHRRSP